MTYGRLVCLSRDEFAATLRGWCRPLPLLEQPREAVNPFTREAILTRLPIDRPRAQPNAIEVPSFASCVSEEVHGLGPESVEQLGVVGGVWSEGDEIERVSGQEVSGPPDPGFLIYEFPRELVGSLAKPEEPARTGLATRWRDRLASLPDIWPGLAPLESYLDWLAKMSAISRTALDCNANVYLAVAS